MASQNHPLKSEIHPAAKGYTADKIRTKSGERDKSSSPPCWMETCSWSRMVVPLNECYWGIFLFWKASTATFLTSTNDCFFAMNVFCRYRVKAFHRKQVLFTRKNSWNAFVIMLQYVLYNDIYSKKLLTAEREWYCKHLPEIGEVKIKPEWDRLGRRKIG